MNDEYKKPENLPVEDWVMGEPEIQPEQPVGTDNFDITLVGMPTPTDPAVTEDWSMNVANPNPTVEKASDGWEMPPPVFRISSGKKMDKTNRKTPPQPLPDSEPTQETTPMMAAPPNLDIQPQPFISEEFAASAAVIKTPPKAKGKTSKLIFLIFGLLAMLILSAAFLLGVYIWFFKPVE